jgi:hypothetical protein
MAGQGPATAQSGTSTPATTGGVTGATTPSTTTQQSGTTAGAIGSNAGTSPTPSTAGPSVTTTGVSVNDTATLQSQIQNALQNEPTLKNDNVSVNVTDSTIELGGNVQTGKEKQTARRIASSFAGNRRVKDRITVSGKGAASNSTPNSGSMGTNPSSNPNNNSNPTPNHSQNPSANSPAANGDASTNPR